MERFDLVCVEQPVARYEMQAMADVRRKTTIPVMADESVHGARDALRLIQLGACDLINIKLMKSGGLLRGLDVNAIAKTAAVACQIGSMVESAVATAAGLHLAAACEGLDTVEVAGPVMLADDLAEMRHLYDGDRVRLPEGPGLGIDIDERAVERLATSRDWVRG
jgi:L-Ala-D/L-Glu epimerase